jgi:pyridoxamine 5'-phosphate oxidase
VKIDSSRKTYERSALTESTIDANPIVQLQRWLDEAYADDAIHEANAMCVATVDREGQPSARIVLLRGLDDRGLTFYTSYFSRKGRELHDNPRTAAVFYWPALERQVRVEGTVGQLSDDESDAYFESRPRGHRLSAWASEQSERVESRTVLDERLAHFDERFGEDEVPRPHSWGGYLIAPSRVEFWQGRPNRMHDRLEYVREGRAWAIHRLQP